MSELPTKQQLRELHRLNRNWPDELADIPPPWPTIPENMRTDSVPLRVMRSRRFLCIVWDQDGTVRLSIQRTEYDLATRRMRDGITWDELVAVKRQAGFGDRCAVELFPPDDKIVNYAPIRHLFLVDAPVFMW